MRSHPPFRGVGRSLTADGRGMDLMICLLSLLNDSVLDIPWYSFLNHALALWDFMRRGA